MKKKSIVIACIAILAVGIFAASYFLYFKNNKGIEFEDNAVSGIMPGVDLEQRKKELQEQLDKSMIAFSINTSPVFSSGVSEGNIMIENPEQNKKLIVAQIQINDTQEVIYESKYIKPGNYIENVKLDKVLEKGTYEATTYFKAYDEETNKFIGQTAAEITITVQS